MDNNINILDLIKMITSFKNGNITLNFDNYQLVADLKLNKLNTVEIKEFEPSETNNNKIKKNTIEWKPLEDIDKPSKNDYLVLQDEGWGFNTRAKKRNLHLIIKNNKGHLVRACRPEDKGYKYYDGTNTEYNYCPKCLELSKKYKKEKCISLKDLESHTIMLKNPVPEDESDIYIEAVNRAIVIYRKSIIGQMKRLGGINHIHVDQTTIYFYTDDKIIKTMVVRTDVTQDAEIHIKHVEIKNRDKHDNIINGYAIKINNIVSKVIEERQRNG